MIPKNQLPREKAIEQGIKALSDAELMAIIFGTGIQGKNVVQLCGEILDDNDNHISYIARMDCRQFMERYKGIGPAKALTLLAGIELGVMASADAMSINNPVISSSRAAYDHMLPHFYGLDHEQFWGLLLNNSNKPIRKFRISQGGLSSTPVDIRLLLREALIGKATGMIVFHNHPTGNLTPSTSDRTLTDKILAAAKICDIRLMDHVIVTDNGYYSFNDNGLLH